VNDKETEHIGRQVIEMMDITCNERIPTASGSTQYVIRSLRRDETELLKDFLYEAIFIPKGVVPPGRDIIEKPELRVYTDDFGTRKGDNCLVADIGGKVVGAVWTSIMADYGHVDDDTPSFAISLYKEYRSMGIGSHLMMKMLGLLKRQGYERASLAVQKANYAVKLYKNVGFRIVDENDEEYIMICDIR
jgi:ribosomal protein S18 acetylase RimI-like enzyme